MRCSCLREVFWSLWMMNITKVTILLLLVSSNAQAEASRTNQYFDAITLHIGQGLSQSLIEIPGEIVAQDLVWDQSYFVAIQLSKDFAREAGAASAFTTGYEVNVLQHRGLQDNSEIAAAYTLRTPNLHLGLIKVNLGIGAGLSYAMGTPSYEDGPVADPDRRYNLQLFLPIELEWHFPDYQTLSFVTRIHHRSGVAGLIAPKHVGSNFLTAGLRYSF